KDIGIGLAYNPGSTYGYYWVQEFGAQPASSGNGSAPFYRFFNRYSGHHFNTTSEVERSAVLAASAAGWSQEGSCCRMLTGALPGTTPVYRLYNARTGDHYYTTTTVERAYALQIG